METHHGYLVGYLYCACVRFLCSRFIHAKPFFSSPFLTCRITSTHWTKDFSTTNQHTSCCMFKVPKPHFFYSHILKGDCDGIGDDRDEILLGMKKRGFGMGKWNGEGSAVSIRNDWLGFEGEMQT